MFRFQDHQADLAVKIEATSRVAFYSDCLSAVISIITGEQNISSSKMTTENLTVEATGYDEEEILVNFLNNFLFVCQVENRYPIETQQIKFPMKNAVQALVNFKSVDGNDSFVREIKAVTYHNLKIVKHPTWQAVIVFDV